MEGGEVTPGEGAEHVLRNISTASWVPEPLKILMEIYHAAI